MECRLVYAEKRAQKRPVGLRTVLAGGVRVSVADISHKRRRPVYEICLSVVWFQCYHLEVDGTR